MSKILIECPKCELKGEYDRKKHVFTCKCGYSEKVADIVQNRLPCRDGRGRSVEPCTFPLVDGAAARVGMLRGYGNAIVAPQAQQFITAYMEATQ